MWRELEARARHAVPRAVRGGGENGGHAELGEAVYWCWALE